MVHPFWKSIIPNGPKYYFPNLVFSIIRSGRIHRSPNTFTFRVPTFLTRYDIAQYLEKLYGVTVESIRTQNFLSKITRQGKRKIPGKKNAIVTIKDDGFRYPPPPPPNELIFPDESMEMRYPKIRKK